MPLKEAIKELILLNFPEFQKLNELKLDLDHTTLDVNKPDYEGISAIDLCTTTASELKSLLLDRGRH